jgi:hypothetical protein
MLESASALNASCTAINKVLQLNAKTGVTLGTVEWKLGLLLVRENKERQGSTHAQSCDEEIG